MTEKTPDNTNSRPSRINALREDIETLEVSGTSKFIDNLISHQGDPEFIKNVVPAVRDAVEAVADEANSRDKVSRLILDYLKSAGIDKNDTETLPVKWLFEDTPVIWLNHG